MLFLEEFSVTVMLSKTYSHTQGQSKVKKAAAKKVSKK